MSKTGAPAGNQQRMIQSRWRRLSRLVVEEVPAYLRSAGSGAAPRCLIFAQGRTGTWLLQSLLNQHPGLHFEKEVLQQRVLFPRHFLLGKAQAAHPLGYGCHVQINQLLATQSVDPKGFLTSLCNCGWRIIYVRRRDIVRQSISAILANQRRLWVSHDGQPENATQVEIDISQVIARIGRRQSHLAQEAQILASLPHLPLVYEDDLQQEAEHQSTADKIFGYLGLGTASVQAQTHRISPTDLEDVISNFEQMMKQISSTFPTLMADRND